MRKPYLRFFAGLVVVLLFLNIGALSQPAYSEGLTDFKHVCDQNPGENGSFLLSIEGVCDEFFNAQGEYKKGVEGVIVQGEGNFYLCFDPNIAPNPLVFKDTPERTRRSLGEFCGEFDNDDNLSIRDVVIQRDLASENIMAANTGLECGICDAGGSDGYIVRISPTIHICNDCLGGP